MWSILLPFRIYLQKLSFLTVITIVASIYSATIQQYIYDDDECNIFRSSQKKYLLQQQVSTSINRVGLWWCHCWSPVVSRDVCSGGIRSNANIYLKEGSTASFVIQYSESMFSFGSTTNWWHHIISYYFMCWKYWILNNVDYNINIIHFCLT